MKLEKTIYDSLAKKIKLFLHWSWCLARRLYNYVTPLSCAIFIVATEEVPDNITPSPSSKYKNPTGKHSIYNIITNTLLIHERIISQYYVIVSQIAECLQHKSVIRMLPTSAYGIEMLMQELKG